MSPQVLEDFRLKVFLTLVKCGSFTLAARELGVSQPAVSQNVAELERLLDATLLERRRGGISLTPEGERFRDCASRIMHWYDVARQTVKTPLEPLSLPLDGSSDLQIWTSGGDIHLSVKKK